MLPNAANLRFVRVTLLGSQAALGFSDFDRACAGFFGEAQRFLPADHFHDGPNVIAVDLDVFRPDPTDNERGQDAERNSDGRGFHPSSRQRIKRSAHHVRTNELASQSQNISPLHTG